ncbi:MAG: hypothetical protein ABI355_01720 [Solirubrobacteraceae bacterium]
MLIPELFTGESVQTLSTGGVVSFRTRLSIFFPLIVLSAREKTDRPLR